MSAPPAEISAVKNIIRRLIALMEVAAGGEEEARKNLDTILGSRSSLVSALSGLTELLFKIEAYEAAQPQGAAHEPPVIPLDEKDLALVRHFLRRLKSQAGMQE